MKNKIRDLRRRRGWSLKKLSELSGVPVNTLWRIENGRGSTLRNAFRIADTFQLTIYELWSIPPCGSGPQVPKSDETGTKTLHQLRAERGWRLRDLSQLSGVSKTTIGLIESGHTPTLKNAIRIAGVFGVSVYQIWEHSGPGTTTIIHS